MKKILAMILVAMMILSAVACAEDTVIKRGVLEGDSMEALRTSVHEAHSEKLIEIEFIKYGNLPTLLMDLENGKLTDITFEASVANYIAARNEKITVVQVGIETDFSMMTMENEKEIYAVLNNAIIEMKADGTLDSLIENELKAYIESDPEPKDLPRFEGAKTIKVGVTGDVPPMDYVAVNGKAAGFNVALLAEIANRAQVNIELVQIETGARPMALASGKVDAIFWTKSVTCPTCNSIGPEAIEGTLVTESYFTDSAARIMLKTEK